MSKWISILVIRMPFIVVLCTSFSKLCIIRTNGNESLPDLSFCLYISTKKVVARVSFHSILKWDKWTRFKFHWNVWLFYCQYFLHANWAESLCEDGISLFMRYVFNFKFHPANHPYLAHSSTGWGRLVFSDIHCLSSLSRAITVASWISIAYCF